MRRRALLGLVALFFLRGSSCLNVERPYGAPTAQQVLAAVMKRGQQVGTLRAETRMSHQAAGGTVKATVRLMARRGRKLRFDAVSPFDTPLATLVANGDSFVLIDAKKNRRYHGPASPCNLARFIGVLLDPDDLLTILGGSTPLIAHRSASLAWDGRRGEEVLTLVGDGSRQVIRLDGRGRSWDLLSVEVLDDKGEPALRLVMRGHRRVAGIRAPSSIDVHQPRQEARMQLTFRSEEVNISLPSEAFQLPGDDGLPSQRVDCDTQIQP